MNNIQNTISASQARNNFYSLLKMVSKKIKGVTIILRSKVQVVLTHPDEVASWDETMEILTDQKLLSEISKSEIERKTGKTISEKTLMKKLNINQERDLGVCAH